MTMQNCPECNSANLTFFEKRNRYNCNECGANFEDVKQDKTVLRVFISYGRDEYASLAERLKSDLAGRGHEVWFDKERLKEGGDWEAYIDDGLNWVSKDAAIGRVVFIMTPHSVRRPDGYCLNEIAKALGRSIPIIPVMLVFCEPPLSIYRLQYLDMQECYPPDDKPGSYAKQLERLTLALEDQKLDFEGIQSRLLKTLEPISFSADISKLLQDFTGRKWVFDAVDSWLHDPQGSKVFWLTGAPGVGKSAIAAWVRDNRREIGAFHFCDIHSEEKRNPSKLVRSVSYQLSTQLPAYEERLKNLSLEGIVQEYHEAYTLFDKLIVQPMADNFPPPDRTIVILIDALDEATYQKRNEISLFLSRCADKTPKWLRFLVTSRPEPEIKAALQSLSPYLLDTSTDENQADIVAYLRKKLPEITDAQIALLLEKSEGVFLYVRHVCEEIKPGGLSLDRLDLFPRGLGDIYLQFFDRQFCSDINYYEQQISPILCLILASFEPLELGTLMQMIGYANRMELFYRLDRLGSLFPRTGSADTDTIAPFHRSLSDWLTDKERAGAYYLDVEYGHRLLADFGWGEYQNGPEGIGDYSLEWLPSHLAEVGEFERFVTVLHNFDYLMSKTKAGMLERLLADFREILPQLPESFRRVLRIDVAFFRERAHILRRGNDDWPAYKILLQLAIEHADDSPLTFGAEKFLAEGKCDWGWLRRENRVSQAGIDLNQAVLEGHKSWVNGVLILDDGRILSWSGFGDNTLRLWDKDGSLLKELEGHTKTVNGALILEDGCILSWSDDETLRFWGSKGEPLKVLKGHEWYVTGALLLNDGCILSRSSDKTIRLWSRKGELLKTERTAMIKGALSLNEGCVLWWSWDNTLTLWNRERALVKTLTGHTGSVKGALPLNDGRILSWSCDNTLRLWSREGDPLKVLDGHTNEVEGAFCLNNGHILSFSRDNTLRLWSGEGKPLKVMEGHKGAVFEIGALPLNDGRILSWSGDNTLRLWSREGEPLKVLEGHTNPVTGALSLNDGCILSWSWDKTLRLWDREGELLNTLAGHTGSVNGALPLDDGRILSWSSDKTLRVWVKEGEPPKTLEGHAERVKGALSLNDGRILSWSLIGTPLLWDRDGAPIKTLDAHTYRVEGALPLNDGRILSWPGLGGNTLKLWDRDLVLIKTLKGHTDSVFGALQLTDGRILSRSSDHTLRLWSAEGELLKTLMGHTNGIRGALQLNDGRILSWPSIGDNTLRLWDSEGKPLKTLEGHTDSVFGALQIYGGRILSWSSDNTLRLWSGEGKPLKILEGHKRGVNGVFLLNDGRILSWSDNTLRLWSGEGESLKVLKGHTNTVEGALSLSDGCILSWSVDATLRHWSGEGEPLGVAELEDAGCLFAEAAPELYGQECIQGSIYMTARGNVCKVVSDYVKISWNGASVVKAHQITFDGHAVVFQENGQVCFLRTYYGNKRVSIEGLEQIVVEKDGLELC